MQKSPILGVWWVLAAPLFHELLKDTLLCNFAKVRQVQSDYWRISYYEDRHLKKSCKPVILWTPGANRKCFAVIVSPLLTWCTKPAEYDCINIPVLTSTWAVSFSFKKHRNKQSHQFRKFCWKLVNHWWPRCAVTFHSSVKYLLVIIFQPQQHNSHYLIKHKNSDKIYFALTTISAVLSFVAKNNSWCGNRSLSFFFNLCRDRVSFTPIP